MSLIVRDIFYNKLEEVKECENESGSDAFSHEASMHVIVHSNRQVTVKNLAASLRAKPIN